MNARKCVAISALAIVWLFSGCATTSSTIDVQHAKAPAAAAKGLARITEVREVRSFEAAPKDPSTPSLENPQDLKNSAITLRAIARKRGGYGMAFANVLLPEGRTVEIVVREAVTKAAALSAVREEQERRMKLGMVGLGRMGGNMPRRPRSASTAKSPRACADLTTPNVYFAPDTCKSHASSHVIWSTINGNYPIPDT